MPASCAVSRGCSAPAVASGLTQIGGYVGLLTAIAAFYASARTIINDAFEREILPG